MHETEESPDNITRISRTKKVLTETDGWPISAESNLISLHFLRSLLVRSVSIYQRCVQHPEDASLRSYHPCPGGFG